MTEMKQKNTSERIMAAALKEFAAYGLAGARVDRIARRAGVNKAMIYYHFSSKEKLYDSIIAGKIKELIGFIDASLKRSASLEELLTELAEFYATLFTPASAIGPLLLRELASGGERITGKLAAFGTELKIPTRLKSMVDRGKREGRYRQIDSRQAIISFVGMNLFYLTMSPLVNSIWEIRNDKNFRRQRPQAVVDLFLHGLEAK